MSNNNKKKLLLLTERLKTGFGVDLVVYEQVKRLNKDFNIEVWAVDIDKEFKKSKLIKAKEVRMDLAFNPLKQHFFSKNAIKKYKKELNQFDAVVAHTPNFYPWLKFFPKKTKKIIYYHGNSLSSGYKFPKNYRKPTMDWLDNSFYFKHADNIVAISEFIRSDVSNKYANKTQVIYSGSDHIFNAYKKFQTGKENIRNKYFFKKNQKIISYIGRLDYRNNPYKNTRLLFNLNFYLKWKYGDNFKLVAMGFPENKIEAEMYQNDICVIPKAPIEDMSAILKESSVLVSPSLWEGLNMPLLEAQRMGVPVVAFDVGAHSEVVKDKRTGFLIKKEDDEKFIQTTEKILINNKLQKTLADNALEFASQFTWENNITQLKELL